MIFSEKLQLLRKNSGFTQESFAERLNVSGQAVAKWECGKSYPNMTNLIQISNMLNVTVDYLVKDQYCSVKPLPDDDRNIDEIIDFRLEASGHTYVIGMNKSDATRFDSHDYRYVNGKFAYHDTFVGSEKFAGQEAIWESGKIVYAMNYAGRVLDERYNGNFLKVVLGKADHNMPYRGPKHYQSGEYLYKSKVAGDFKWFQGYEEIYWREEKIYECHFHGGLMQ